MENVKVKTLRSKTYNFNFNKVSGYFERWGRTLEDDPDYSPYGPEILDLEISTSVRPEQMKNYDKDRLIYDGGCLGKCAFCSPAGTKVNTPDGLVNIEDVKIGDYVLSYDTKQQAYKKNIIKETIERPFIGEIIIIETEVGEILELTPEHPVWTLNRGWVDANNLTVEDEIKTIIEYTNIFCKHCGDRIIKGDSYKRYYCSEECYNSKHIKEKCKICGSDFNIGLNKHFCLNCLGKMNIDNSHELSETYRSMFYRCYVPTRINFKDYGGKGIKVCERWMRFENFVEDVGEKPSDDHTLDRFDFNLNYEPSNVVWGDKNEQRINRDRFSNSSRKYKGVWQTNKNGGFQALFSYENEKIYLGTFPTEEEAARAYNKKLKEFYPDRYKLLKNKINGVNNEN